MKNVQKFMDAKNQEVSRLADLKAQLKQDKENHRIRLAEIEQEESEIKAALEKYEEEQNDLSIDVIVADWIKTRNFHIQKFIQPALGKAFEAKSQYRAALGEFIKAVETLSNEQKALTGLMEQENMSPTDINRIKTTERYRPDSGDFGKIFIRADEFEELDRKINFIFGR